MTMKHILPALAIAFAVQAAHAEGMQHHHGMQHAQAADHQMIQTETAVATGVVKKINAEKGTVVIAHEPVPALDWPAMVMPFKASVAVIGDIAPGAKVEFKFDASNSTITEIRAL